MGRMKPTMEPRRKVSTLHYQTFPTQPPTSRGRPPSASPQSRNGEHSGSDDEHHESPLPTKQLAILAIIALAEQTALNSINPYLPEMVQTFPEVRGGQVGMYTGVIASAFALAQFATNYFWGWLSDRIGRKPVILTGTALTTVAFLAFGFCKTLWQAILVQAFMGLVNGNAGIVSTCLGEITDRTNQSRAFTYLPVVYGIGAITGPLVGGVLVLYENPFKKGEKNPLPYVLPNLFSAAILVIDLVICIFLLEESHEEARNFPPLGKRVENLFAWLWQFTSSTRPSYLKKLFRTRSHHQHHHHHHHHRRQSDDHLDGIQEEDEEDYSDEPDTPMFPTAPDEQLSSRDILNRDTLLLLATYFIFQLANIAYNSLYPVFAEEPPPTGRGLKPKTVGLSLSFAGLITIVFQVSLYGRLRDRIGNKVTYRVSIAAFVVAFAIMPFVGYKDSPPPFGIGSGMGWLWLELGATLVIKTVASVGGLTSALLLITNSASNNNVLGSLNGLAQTLSAAGRAVGPFISGSLFTAATKLPHKGEALPFGIFAGISLIGFLLGFGIKGEGLEAEGWSSESGEEEEVEDEEATIGGSGNGDANERTGLLRK
ncbi:MFS general substrate transporter [Westerdykella ornata]|uniref:MFS general substrate transporter n=1 Tax=Westerdykella ornata TaxID=318751 RepID=A0A6A6JAB8_WESOR|nr:MFS general substrate transporter [Westerdykella ornata]KAF2273265.1 MFS general substrate transporter [Westerdykella ornata]